MSKTKLYHIIQMSSKLSVFQGTYNDCLIDYNLKDKIYRKTHKIITDEDYQKIIKKKPLL